MPLTISHGGDFHLEEDRYFADTARCIEWFIEDSIQHHTNLFVLDGDLTTYKQTIKERKFWIDAVMRMADHAPVLLVAGNHGKELEDDLYPLAKVKAAHRIVLSAEPAFIDLDDAAIGVFPYPRKAEFVASSVDRSLAERFAATLEEFNRRFEERPGTYRLFFGHFGVAGARVSGGQPLAGRCAEYPLDPLRNLRAQYIGLSHIHLRQQLGARIWYAGSISRCDYSETEAKGYNLVTINEPCLKPDLSDIEIIFRESPTTAMVILDARYDNGELQFAVPPAARQLKNARLKVVVTIPSELHNSLGREEQERFKAQLLAASPSELKVKIERDAETAVDSAPLSRAKTAADKLIAYWALKGEPGAERRDELLHKLAEIETAAISG